MWFLFLVEGDKNHEDYNFLGNSIAPIEINVNFLNHNLARAYYQCLKHAITAHHNHSFLLTLARKSRTCVMALLVSDQSKFSLIVVGNSILA